MGSLAPAAGGHAIDPLTAFAIATLMMLLNGGVLGLVHADLPPALRPSAVNWRIATLLMAGGTVLLMVQRAYPPAFILPLANALLILALTLYWRALRLFYGAPDHVLMLLPTVLTVSAVYWYAAIQPDLAMRVVLVSICWLGALAGSLQALSLGRGDRAVSRRVMMGVFIAVALFTVVRMLWFIVMPAAGASVIDGSSLINILTPLVATVLPVIGTTAFLLMCSERIRRDWERAASTDHLTGLANRRTLAHEGELRLRLASEQARPFALAIIDIDHFKRINDRHGHEVGDQALRHVASLIQQSCRPQDLSARQGGEEFVALYADASAADARQLAEQLRQQVEAQPFPTSTGALALTVSIGVANRAAADAQLDDLLRRADQALYRAKAGGRNRVETDSGLS